MIILFVLSLGQSDFSNTPLLLPIGRTSCTSVTWTSFFSSLVELAETGFQNWNHAARNRHWQTNFKERLLLKLRKKWNEKAGLYPINPGFNKMTAARISWQQKEQDRPPVRLKNWFSARLHRSVMAGNRWVAGGGVSGEFEPQSTKCISVGNWKPEILVGDPGFLRGFL